MTKDAVDKDKRTGWLRDLKVGDKVVVSPPGSRNYLVRTVEKITPTGRLEVGGRTYGFTGSETGTGEWSYHSLVSSDPDQITRTQEENKRATLIHKIKRTFQPHPDLISLSDSALEQIDFLIKMDAENQEALKRVES